MRTAILTIAMLIMTVSVFSQKLIEEKKVPEAVLRTFKKKAGGATEIKWFQKSHEFTAKYKIGEYTGEATFSREGDLILKKTGMDFKKLPVKILDDLAKEHRNKRIHEVFMVEKGRKEKYYSIILHQKQGRKKPPLVFEAQYTAQGKLITVYEPEIEEDAYEPEEEQPSKFVKDVEEEAEELKEKVKDEKISRKDLPSAAENYLVENFDYEYRAKEVIVKNNKQYGQYYYVVMKKQGEKINHILLFDFKGNLIKRSEEEL